VVSNRERGLAIVRLVILVDDVELGKGVCNAGLRKGLEQLALVRLAGEKSW
jgi:hypothetical protein